MKLSFPSRKKYKNTYIYLKKKIISKISIRIRIGLVSGKDTQLALLPPIQHRPQGLDVPDYLFQNSKTFKGYTSLQSRLLTVLTVTHIR